MNKKLFVCIFLYIGSCMASYQLVPMDFSDKNMQEQLCTMILQDQDIQAMTQDTVESILNIWKDKPKDLFGFVCKVTDGTESICGYIFYKTLPHVYFFRYTDSLKDHVCSNDELMQDLLIKNPSIFMKEILESVGYVSSLAVHKNYRGKSIAQTMLEQVEQVCKNNQMQQLMLTVDQSNKKAFNAYVKFGFGSKIMFDDGYITMNKLI